MSNAMTGNLTLTSSTGAINKVVPVPAKNQTFVTEDFVVIEGNPIVPQVWVRATSLISTEGAYYSSTRIDPTEVEIPAHSRFLWNGYDSETGIWQPFVTSGSNYFFRAPPGLAPSLNTVEYEIGDEILRAQALRFNPGDYLISEFNQGVDEAAEFSVVMVLIPDVPLDYTLFATQKTTEEISVDLRNAYYLTFGGKRSTVTIPHPITSMEPTYLVYTQNQNGAMVYVGSSSKTLYRTSMKITDFTLPQMQFLIGKTRAGKATGTFNLMEFSLFNRALSPEGGNGIPSVYAVVAKLSSAYGAS